MYYTNWSFLIKMACLILVIILNYTIHRKMAYADETSGGAKGGGRNISGVVGVVIFGGIFIAFIPGDCKS